MRETFAAKGSDMAAHANYQRDFDGSPAQTVIVQTRTLGSLLDEISAPPIIDYFSLDVEGGELAVLKAFPFDRYRVLCATIESHFEHNGIVIDAAHCRPVREIMLRNGLVLVKQDFANDYFVARELASP